MRSFIKYRSLLLVASAALAISAGFQSRAYSQRRTFDVQDLVTADSVVST